MPNSLFPSVSIIIPIKNEERYIERSLGSVLDQEYPSNCIEILVVDGNSTDHTRELISNLAHTSPFPVLIIDNPTGIVPKALNIGLRQAKGDIIIRVDGHCEIQPDYVSTCVQQLHKKEIDCVGGSIETIGETFIAQVIALAMSSKFGVGGVSFRTEGQESQLTDSVPFPAYHQEVFERIGYFDESMLCNEDDEFNYRLIKHGGKILLDSRLRTKYYCRGSLPSLWRQYFRYGLWKVRILQKHPNQMRLRHFIPAGFIIALLTSTILGLLLPYGWFTLVSILGVYLLVLMAASIIPVRREGLKTALLLPVVFIVLHASYGIGFLSGLIKFFKFFFK